MSDSFRRVVYLSCLHIGSTVALWPTEWCTEEGVIIKANAAQHQILEYWEDFWTHEAVDADSLCLLGDMVQGKNPKDGALGTMTPDLDQQVAACLSLLKPKIHHIKTIYGVSGSKYHDSLDTAIDRRIIESLGGKYYGWLRNVKMQGTKHLVNIAHGGNNPSMYKGSFDDRENMLMSTQSMTREITMFVRGHWHYYHYQDTGNRKVLRVPGWQCWYPAKFMIDMLAKKNNKLGGVCVDFCPDGQVHVHPRRYEPPATWNVPVVV